MAAKQGVALPADLAAIAADEGLRHSYVRAYLAIRAPRRIHAAAGTLAPPPRWLTAIPFVRNRLIYDSRFLFKIAVEAVVDAATCLVAEAAKRGDDFVAELPFVGTDLVVGTFVTTTLVALMAPQALPGREPLAGNGARRRYPAAAVLPQLPYPSPAGSGAPRF